MTDMELARISSGKSKGGKLWQREAQRAKQRQCHHAEADFDSVPFRQGTRGAPFINSTFCSVLYVPRLERLLYTY